jgi:uncharacterized SAM-binding protein YcdF (DUF218 family)
VGALGRGIAVLLLLAVGYVAVTFGQVVLAACSDGARAAEAIVVLGAAQYDGRPSPVLRARLDHAADLYHRSLAPVVVVTGGSRPGDRFTEATAGATYLHGRGVPDAAIRREVSGRSTWESLAATARFLRSEGISEVLLVSDPSHAYRVGAIAAELGLSPSVSPTPTGAVRGADVRGLLRETAAVGLGRLVGYRRITGVGRPLQERASASQSPAG